MPPRAALRRLVAPSSRGASALLPSENDDTYWQALVDTEIFSAPLGNAVADVSEGTVVKERARYVDPFDDKWIATTDETGDAVWLRELEELPFDGDEDDREAEWCVAVPSDEVDGGNRQPAAQPTSDTDILLPAFDASDEIKFFEFYWGSIFEEGSVDWNTEYQMALEKVLFDPTSFPDMDSGRESLQQIVKRFSQDVESGVTSIVTEMFGKTKSNSKIIKHPQSSGVYYIGSILFRMAVDDGRLGGDEVAMKVLSQNAKNIQICSHVAPRYLLAIPLSISMTFGGYKVLACSIPPVGPTASKIICPEGSLCGSLVSGLGAELNIKPFSIGGSLTLSPSFTVVAGQDCRLYIFGLGDLMPAFAPPRSRPSYKPSITSRFWRLRPEAINQCSVPVCSAAFIGGLGGAEHNEVAKSVTNWVRCVGLQMCAAVLGLLEPCTVPGLVRITCCGCGKEVEDELRFGVCTDGCCLICAQCNINAFERLSTASDQEGCLKMLSGFVKCDSKPLGVRSLRLEPDIKTIFHHHGVNLRFLNVVYNLLPRSSKAIIGTFLETEMVARAAKVVLNRRLRRGTTSLQDIGMISASFFMSLMQPEGEMAEKFWADELGPTIQELFDVFVPFDTETLDITNVCARVSDLTGVYLTQESVKSFSRSQEIAETGNTEKHVPTPPRNRRPSQLGSKSKSLSGDSGMTELNEQDLEGQSFIQIHSINPTMKDFSIPVFCNEVGGRKGFLMENLSGLLLVWAGEMDACREQFMMFEKSHPRYLSDEGGHT